MSDKFEFILHDEEITRLFYLKNTKGYNDLTGNEYAKQLLEHLLHKECPRQPQTDENGRFIAGSGDYKYKRSEKNE